MRAGLWCPRRVRRRAVAERSDTEPNCVSRTQKERFGITNKRRMVRFFTGVVITDQTEIANVGYSPQLVVALLPISTDDDLGSFEATNLPPSLMPGVRIRTVMKSGCAFAHASAFCLLSTNRSITMALRSAGCRPHERAALRLTTSGPVSTATHAASGKITLLP